MQYTDFSELHDSHDWDLILSICEDFTQEPKPGLRPGNLKRKAAAYIGTDVSKNVLSKTELRVLLAKARKMKKSSKKEERAKGIQLEKQVRCAFNFRND